MCENHLFILKERISKKDVERDKMENFPLKMN
jgi:hypothetical protein